MAFFKTATIAGVGFCVALAIGEAGSPGSANKTVKATVNGAAPALQGAGVVAGQAIRSTGPVIDGAKGALADAGLEDLLTPTTVPPTGVAPAQQPAPAVSP